MKKRQISDRQQIAQLIKQKIRDDAVLHSIGDGLIVIIDVDKGGKIVYVNKIFEQMTGWKSTEVLNKSIIDILPRENKQGKKVSFKDRIVTKVLSGQKVIADLTQPFYYVRKDKTRFPVSSVITPIILNKKIVGAVETFRDISKESESDKAKTEFASLVSHQLRTPFATINWYVELLLSQDAGRLNEKQLQYLKEVYKASQRMVALVNVLLSVSRIEMGITKMEKKLVNVPALAKTIINEEKPKIKEKSLKIKETYGKNIPKIFADPKQLTIVFQNLISNAIKYSLKGGKIIFKIKRQNSNILISVADSGIGIPKADQPKIFDRFFRANNAKEKEPEGIGLGLYILKAVVKMLNGQVLFKSKQNKGTTFYITIPILKKPKKRKKK
jgi:two-component system sensor histidine kinase VicK